MTALRVAAVCGSFFNMTNRKSEWARKDRAKNPEKYRKICREYRAKMPPEVREKIREREKEYKRIWLQNPVNRLAHSLRTRMGKFVRNGQSATKELGCSVVELKSYLESKFLPGMTWENYGSWHVDHIQPLSKFKLTDSVEFAKAAHYTNLQPMWAADNIKKRNK